MANGITANAPSSQTAVVIIVVLSVGLCLVSLLLGWLVYSKSKRLHRAADKHNHKSQIELQNAKQSKLDLIKTYETDDASKGALKRAERDDDEISVDELEPDLASNGYLVQLMMQRQRMASQPVYRRPAAVRANNPFLVAHASSSVDGVKRALPSLPVSDGGGSARAPSLSVPCRYGPGFNESVSSLVYAQASQGAEGRGQHAVTSAYWMPPKRMEANCKAQKAVTPRPPPRRRRESESESVLEAMRGREDDGELSQVTASTTMQMEVPMSGLPEEEELDEVGKARRHSCDWV